MTRADALRPCSRDNSTAIKVLEPYQRSKSSYTFDGGWDLEKVIVFYFAEDSIRNRFVDLSIRNGKK